MITGVIFPKKRKLGARNESRGFSAFCGYFRITGI